MKNILIIHPGPFGYHTPTYYYCLLLKNKYQITYLGIDENRENKNIEGIRYIHLPAGQNSVSKRISYFKAIKREVEQVKYDFVLVNYFVFCSFLRFISNANYVLEIRTSFIFTSFIKRFIYNAILIIESRLFRNITTISHDLARFLILPDRTYIVPLGAPKFPIYNKDFSSMNILYVGTFYEREIPKTIHAVAKFVNEFKDKADISYTIIGFGSEIEIENIRLTIRKLEMDKYITYKGVVRYPELNEYFRNNNIGMSYIPLKKRYDSQPPIKSFEYLLSGMAVLATGTKENRKIINELNGIITGDSIDDVYSGLKHIFSKLNKFNSLNIQTSSGQYSWESIVENILIPYIEDISYRK